MGTPDQERKAPHSPRSPQWGRAWEGEEPVELSTTEDDHEGKGRRAKHTGRHRTPPHPKLTSGGTCPSRHWPLSGHRDSSRQRIPKQRRGQWCSEQGWHGGGQASVPAQPTRVGRTSSAWPGRSVDSFWAFTSHTFSVLSLLLLTRSRLSADHAIWYTAATWPRREARYLGQGGGR